MLYLCKLQTYHIFKTKNDPSYNDMNSSLQKQERPKPLLIVNPQVFLKIKQLWMTVIKCVLHGLHKEINILCIKFIVTLFGRSLNSRLSQWTQDQR